MLRLIGLLCASAVLALNAAPAVAQYPDKPLRFVVPFPPGGGNDIVARALSEGMAKQLGQPVIVENRPGAGTVIGTEFAATRPPDGYTVLLISPSFAINPSLLTSLPYDPFKSFAPILLLGRYPNVVVVPPDGPFKTIAELTAFAKANPGKLNYGSFGNGTSPHLFAEMYKAMSGADITHIPYKGASPAITDLLGGRIDVVFSTASSAGTYIRSGRLRALAVTSGRRAAVYPDLPTMAEAGVAGYEAISWYGVVAPAGTPPELIARLRAAIEQAAQAETFRKRSAEDGLEVAIEGPDALTRHITKEMEVWGRVIRAANIKPD